MCHLEHRLAGSLKLGNGAQGEREWPTGYSYKGRLTKKKKKIRYEKGGQSTQKAKRIGRRREKIRAGTSQTQAKKEGRNKGSSASHLGARDDDNYRRQVGQN